MTAAPDVKPQTTDSSCSTKDTGAPARTRRQDSASRIDGVLEFVGRRGERNAQMTVMPAVDREARTRRQQHPVRANIHHHGRAECRIQLDPHRDAALRVRDTPLRQFSRQHSRQRVAPLTQQRRSLRGDGAEVGQHRGSHRLLELGGAEVVCRPGSNQTSHEVPLRADPAHAESAPDRLAQRADPDDAGGVAACESRVASHRDRCRGPLSSRRARAPSRRALPPGGSPPARAGSSTGPSGSGSPASDMP